MFIQIWGNRINFKLHFRISMKNRKKKKKTHLENSKQCVKRSIDFDFRGKGREYKKLYVIENYKIWFNILKFSLHSLNLVKKLDIYLIVYWKNSFGYWLFIERNFINDAIYLVNNEQEGLCLSCIVRFFRISYLQKFS